MTLRMGLKEKASAGYVEIRDVDGRCRPKGRPPADAPPLSEPGRRDVQRGAAGGLPECAGPGRQADRGAEAGRRRDPGAADGRAGRIASGSPAASPPPPAASPAASRRRPPRPSPAVGGRLRAPAPAAAVASKPGGKKVYKLAVLGDVSTMDPAIMNSADRLPDRRGDPQLHGPVHLRSAAGEHDHP